MKKIIFFVLASILISPVFAQKKNNQVDTLQKIAQKGTIVLAVRESSMPFSYYDANGNIIGYSVELCEKVARKIKENLSLDKLKIVYLPVDPIERMDVVKDGMADMECGVTTNTTERQKNVAFSLSIFAVENRFVTQKNFSFDSVSELNNKQIAVSEESIGESYVKEQKKENKLNYTINTYKDTKEAMFSVLDGTSVATPNDDILLVSQLAFNPLLQEKLHLTGTPFLANTYSIVLPKGDTKFKELVDNSLKDIITSGEIQKIYEKWFMTAIPPKNINLNFPMNETTKKIFSNPNDRALIEK